MAGAELSLPRAVPDRDSALRRGDLAVMLGLSTVLVLLTAAKVWPIGWLEVFGFASGGICVWLIVREHPWNWPLGMINNAVFFALFLDARLYADMALQVLYFGISIYGWRQWRQGGADGGALAVSRTRAREWSILALAVPVATLSLHPLLVATGDAAPWADAFTTVLCVAAQLLLTHKRIENWAFWIAADAVYVPLYLARALPLTALLYAVLLVLCLLGWRAWRAP